MSLTRTNPVDVPPYQIQGLVSRVYNSERSSGKVHAEAAQARVTCAQAFGSEIYAGCSNGELLRFTLQEDDPNQLESYRLVSRQTLPNHKPIDEIVLVPCISRALILSDHQIHFYIVPSLDPVPHNIIKPVRNVVTFTVDYNHLMRTPPSTFGGAIDSEPVELCVIKRSAIAMFALRDKLVFQKEIPLPQGSTLARRVGRYLCAADKEFYNMIDLDKASIFPVLPLSQAPNMVVKPSITVIADAEFLMLSWTGSGTLGVFISGDGDPVRGTLEWASFPEDVCLDYPYVAALLPNGTIDIHSLETQSIVQVVPASSEPEKLRLTSCLSGFLVPSSQESDKMLVDHNRYFGVSRFQTVQHQYEDV